MTDNSGPDDGIPEPRSVPWELDEGNTKSPRVVTFQEEIPRRRSTVGRRPAALDLAQGAPTSSPIAPAPRTAGSNTAGKSPWARFGPDNRPRSMLASLSGIPEDGVFLTTTPETATPQNRGPFVRRRRTNSGPGLFIPTLNRSGDDVLAGHATVTDLKKSYKKLLFTLQSAAVENNQLKEKLRKAEEERARLAVDKERDSKLHEEKVQQLENEVSELRSIRPSSRASSRPSSRDGVVSAAAQASRAFLTPENTLSTASVRGRSPGDVTTEERMHAALKTMEAKVFMAEARAEASEASLRICMTELQVAKRHLEDLEEVTRTTESQYIERLNQFQQVEQQGRDMWFGQEAEPQRNRTSPPAKTEGATLTEEDLESNPATPTSPVTVVDVAPGAPRRRRSGLMSLVPGWARGIIPGQGGNRTSVPEGSAILDSPAVEHQDVFDSPTGPKLGSRPRRSSTVNTGRSRAPTGADTVPREDFLALAEELSFVRGNQEGLLQQLPRPVTLASAGKLNLNILDDEAATIDVMLRDTTWQPYTETQAYNPEMDDGVVREQKTEMLARAADEKEKDEESVKPDESKKASGDPSAVEALASALIQGNRLRRKEAEERDRLQRMKNLTDMRANSLQRHADALKALEEEAASKRLAVERSEAKIHSLEVKLTEANVIKRQFEEKADIAQEAIASRGSLDEQLKAVQLLIEPLQAEFEASKPDVGPEVEVPEALMEQKLKEHDIFVEYDEKLDDFRTFITSVVRHTGFRAHLVEIPEDVEFVGIREIMDRCLFDWIDKIVRETNSEKFEFGKAQDELHKAIDVIAEERRMTMQIVGRYQADTGLSAKHEQLLEEHNGLQDELAEARKKLEALIEEETEDLESAKDSLYSLTEKVGYLSGQLQKQEERLKSSTLQSKPLRKRQDTVRKLRRDLGDAKSDQVAAARKVARLLLMLQEHKQRLRENWSARELELRTHLEETEQRAASATTCFKAYIAELQISIARANAKLAASGRTNDGAADISAVDLTGIELSEAHMRLLKLQEEREKRGDFQRELEQLTDMGGLEGEHDVQEKIEAVKKEDESYQKELALAQEQYEEALAARAEAEQRKKEADENAEMQRKAIGRLTLELGRTRLELEVSQSQLHAARGALGREGQGAEEDRDEGERDWEIYASSDEADEESGQPEGDDHDSSHDREETEGEENEGDGEEDRGRSQSQSQSRPQSRSRSRSHEPEIPSMLSPRPRLPSPASTFRKVEERPLYNAMLRFNFDSVLGELRLLGRDYSLLGEQYNQACENVARLELEREDLREQLEEQLGDKKEEEEMWQDLRKDRSEYLKKWEQAEEEYKATSAECSAKDEEIQKLEAQLAELTSARGRGTAEAEESCSLGEGDANAKTTAFSDALNQTEEWDLGRDGDGDEVKNDTHGEAEDDISNYEYKPPTSVPRRRRSSNKSRSTDTSALPSISTDPEYVLEDRPAAPKVSAEQVQSIMADIEEAFNEVQIAEADLDKAQDRRRAQASQEAAPQDPPSPEDVQEARRRMGVIQSKLAEQKARLQCSENPDALNALIQFLLKEQYWYNARLERSDQRLADLDNHARSMENDLEYELKRADVQDGVVEKLRAQRRAAQEDARVAEAERERLRGELSSASQAIRGLSNELKEVTGKQKNKGARTKQTRLMEQLDKLATDLAQNAAATAQSQAKPPQPKPPTASFTGIPGLPASPLFSPQQTVETIPTATTTASSSRDDTCQQKLKKAEEELAMAMKEIEGLKENLKEADAHGTRESENDDCTQRLAAARVEIERLAAELKQLQTTMVNDAAQSADRIRNAEERSREAESKVQKFAKMVSKYTAHRDDWVNQQHRRALEIDSLKTKVAGLEAKVQGAEDAKAKADFDETELFKLREFKKNHLASKIDNKLQRLKGTIAHLKGALDEHTKEERECPKKLKAMEQRLRQAQRDVLDAKEDVQMEQCRYNDLQKDLNQVLQENWDLTVARREQDDMLDRQNADIQSLWSDLEKLTQEKIGSDLALDLSGLKLTDGQKERMETAKQELAERQQLAAQHEAEISKLQGQVEFLATELNAAKEAAEKQPPKECPRCKKLEAELQTVTQERADAVNGQIDANRSLDEARRDLSVANDAAVDAWTEADTLRSQQNEILFGNSTLYNEVNRLRGVIQQLELQPRVQRVDDDETSDGHTPVRPPSGLTKSRRPSQGQIMKQKDALTRQKRSCILAEVKYQGLRMQLGAAQSGTESGAVETIDSPEPENIENEHQMVRSLIDQMLTQLDVTRRLPIFLEDNPDLDQARNSIARLQAQLDALRNAPMNRPNDLSSILQRLWQAMAHSNIFALTTEAISSLQEQARSAQKRRDNLMADLQEVQRQRNDNLRDHWGIYEQAQKMIQDLKLQVQLAKSGNADQQSSVVAQEGGNDPVTSLKILQLLQDELQEEVAKLRENHQTQADEKSERARDLRHAQREAAKQAADAVALLEKERTAFKEQHQKCQARISELEILSSGLESKLDKALIEMGKKLKASEELQKAREKLKALPELEQERARLQDENLKFRNDIYDLRVSLGRGNTHKADEPVQNVQSNRAAQTHADTFSEIAALRKKMEKLNQQFARLIGDLNTSKDEASKQETKLLRQIAEKDSKIRASEKRADTLLEHVTLQVRQLQEAENERDQLKVEMKHLEKTVAALALHEAESPEEEKEDEEASVKKKCKDAHDCKKKLRAAENEISTLSEKLDVANATIAAAMNSLKDVPREKSIEFWLRMELKMAAEEKDQLLKLLEGPDKLEHRFAGVNAGNEFDRKRDWVLQWLLQLSAHDLRNLVAWLLGENIVLKFTLLRQEDSLTSVSMHLQDERAAHKSQAAGGGKDPGDDGSNPDNIDSDDGLGKPEKKDKKKNPDDGIADEGYDPAKLNQIIEEEFTGSTAKKRLRSAAIALLKCRASPSDLKNELRKAEERNRMLQQDYDTLNEQYEYVMRKARPVEKEMDQCRDYALGRVKGWDGQSLRDLLEYLLEGDGKKLLQSRIPPLETSGVDEQFITDLLTATTNSMMEKHTKEKEKLAKDRQRLANEKDEAGRLHLKISDSLRRQLLHAEEQLKAQKEQFLEAQKLANDARIEIESKEIRLKRLKDRRERVEEPEISRLKAEIRQLSDQVDKEKREASTKTAGTQTDKAKHGDKKGSRVDELERRILGLDVKMRALEDKRRQEDKATQVNEDRIQEEITELQHKVKEHETTVQDHELKRLSLSHAKGRLDAQMNVQNMLEAPQEGRVRLDQELQQLQQLQQFQDGSTQTEVQTLLGSHVSTQTETRQLPAIPIAGRCNGHHDVWDLLGATFFILLEGLGANIDAFKSGFSYLFVIVTSVLAFIFWVMNLVNYYGIQRVWGNSDQLQSPRFRMLEFPHLSGWQKSNILFQIAMVITICFFLKARALSLDLLDLMLEANGLTRAYHTEVTRQSVQRWVRLQGLDNRFSQGWHIPGAGYVNPENWTKIWAVLMETWERLFTKTFKG